MATEAGVEPAIQESKSRALPFGYSAIMKNNAFLIRSVKRELSPSRLATHGRPVAAIAAVAVLVGLGGDGKI